jgi:hypothetical protein
LFDLRLSFTPLGEGKDAPFFVVVLHKLRRGNEGVGRKASETLAMKRETERLQALRCTPHTVKLSLIRTKPYKALNIKAAVDVLSLVSRLTFDVSPTTPGSK